MPAILVAGRNRNFLARAGILNGQLSASIPPAGSDESALFPLPGLYDQDTVPFQFGTKDAARSIWIDLNMIQNPGFEDDATNAIVPSGWTVKTGTFITDDTTVVPVLYAGSYVALLFGSSPSAYQILMRPAGEAFTVSWAIYASSSEGTARVQVINMETGHYLDENGVWQAAEAWVVTYGTAAWAAGSVDSTIETLTECGTDLARIMIRLSGPGANTFYDEIVYHPHVDFAALFGHNIEPHVAVDVYSSTTGDFTGEETLRATMTYEPRNMWWAGSSLITDRYWLLKFVDAVDLDLATDTDTAFAPIGITEGFLGQKTVLLQAQEWNYSHNLMADQGRSSMGGLTRIYSRNLAPVEGFSLVWHNTTVAAYEELRDLVFYAAQLGAVKSVFVPDDTRRDIAYGCFGPSAESAREFLTVWGTPLQIESMPAAVFVS